MRRYIVVAHRTLGGEHLIEELQRRRAADPECTFHLIVPEYHASKTGWDDLAVHAAAQAALAEMLERMVEIGIDATGEVGASNPVYAVGQLLNREGADAYSGIILSTLPRGISNWWLIGVPSRMATAYPQLPLTHVVADEVPAGASRR